MDVTDNQPLFECKKRHFYSSLEHYGIEMKRFQHRSLILSLRHWGGGLMVFITSAAGRFILNVNETLNSNLTSDFYK